MYPKNHQASNSAREGVNPSPSFPKIEEQILEFWKQDGTFQASIDQRKAAGGAVGAQHLLARTAVGAARNAARAKMVKAGKARKGDGKDVDHIRPLSKGGTSAKTNLRMRSVKANRGDK